jgi:hypothetical protein
VIGGSTVTLIDKSGRVAKLAIKADPSVKVDAPIGVKTGVAQASKGISTS